MRTRSAAAITAALSAGAVAATVGIPIGARADSGPTSNNAWCTGGMASMPNVGPGSLLIGEILDWTTQTASAAASRLGRSPSIYSVNVPFPLDNATFGFLDSVADEVAHEGAILGVTLDLSRGLGAGYVNSTTADALANRLKTYNTVEGLPVFLRIGPEMNGSWNAWGQQPLEFVAAFRTIANAVHTIDPAVATVWSPNYGGGAPWAGHAYSAQPGTADFAALDTNGDGQLTQADDPYAPYWPGDSYVDEVGLSLYHFGNKYPWGPNVVPEPGKLAAEVTGTYDGANGDETAVPDFYGTYADGPNKPFVLSETGAWYDPSRTDGDSESAIKTAWWQQVMGSSTLQQFPRLKAVTFFNLEKQETTATSTPTTVDWRIDGSPALASQFDSALPPGAVMADGVPCYAGPAPGLSPVSPPPGYKVPNPVPPATVKRRIVELLPRFTDAHHWSHSGRVRLGGRSAALAPHGRLLLADPVRGLAGTFVVDLRSVGAAATVGLGPIAVQVRRVDRTTVSLVEWAGGRAVRSLTYRAGASTTIPLALTLRGGYLSAAIRSHALRTYRVRSVTGLSLAGSGTATSTVAARHVLVVTTVTRAVG